MLDRQVTPTVFAIDLLLVVRDLLLDEVACALGECSSAPGDRLASGVANIVCDAASETLLLTS